MTRNVKVGDRFGSLVVINAYQSISNRRWQHLCRCDCGKIGLYVGFNLKRRKKAKCEHSINIADRFTYLVVLRSVGVPYGKKGKYYECKCDCGKIKIVKGSYLSRGDTKSCGCYKSQTTSKRRKVHGGRRTHLYYIWSTMKARCFKPTLKTYKYYGAKGISVCNEWLDFSVFQSWAMLNGYQDGLSIDRINSDGNYCPENCRWITRSENARKSQLEKSARKALARQLVGG